MNPLAEDPAAGLAPDLPEYASVTETQRYIQPGQLAACIGLDLFGWRRRDRRGRRPLPIVEVRLPVQAGALIGGVAAGLVLLIPANVHGNIWPHWIADSKWSRSSS